MEKKLLNAVEENKLKKYIDSKYTSKVYELNYLDIIKEAKLKEEKYINITVKEKIKLKNKKELLNISDEKVNFIISFAKEINNITSAVNNTFNLDIKSESLDRYNKLFKIIAENPNFNKKWIDKSVVTTVEKLIDDYRTSCKKLQGITEELLRNFHKDVLNIDEEELLMRFKGEYYGLIKYFKISYYKDVRLIKSFYRGNEKLSDEFLQNTLKSCKDIKELKAYIFTLEEELKYYLEDKFIGENTPWQDIYSSISTMNEFYAKITLLGQKENMAFRKAICSDDNIKKLCVVIKKINYILENYEVFKENLKLLYDEKKDFNDVKSIIILTKVLLEYKEYFKAVDNRLSEVLISNEPVAYEELERDLYNIKLYKDITNKTLDYYNTNSDKYIESTLKVHMNHLYNDFLGNISDGAHILDLGCGSGRDSKFFLEKGYKVTAVDGSEKIAEGASKFLGQEVIVSSFEELNLNEVYDGIWACASLLHVDRKNIVKVIEKISSSLKENGVFYMSFKYGDNEYIDENGRYFNCYIEETFTSMIKTVDKLNVEKMHKTGDILGGRDSLVWLNILLRKDSRC